MSDAAYAAQIIADLCELNAELLAALKLARNELQNYEIQLYISDEIDSAIAKAEKLK